MALSEWVSALHRFPTLWEYRDRRKPEVDTMSYCYPMMKGVVIGHSVIFVAYILDNTHDTSFTSGKTLNDAKYNVCIRSIWIIEGDAHGHRRAVNTLNSNLKQVMLWVDIGVKPLAMYVMLDREEVMYSLGRD